MTKKMIERYVIVNIDNEVVTAVEEINPKYHVMVKSEDDILRVYDREERKTIVKIDSGDKACNFFIAEAVVAACDEYVPPEPEEDIPIDGGDDGSD